MDDMLLEHGRDQPSRTDCRGLNGYASFYQSRSSGRVLLLGGSRVLRDDVARGLGTAGLNLHMHLGRGDVLRRIGDEAISLVIVGPSPGGECVFQTVRRLRELEHLGILLLGAGNDVTDRIVGLEVGADDYLAVPFDGRELAARAKSILRRVTLDRIVSSKRRHRLRFSDWVLDPDTRAVQVPGGGGVSLAGGEYDLLSALLAHPNRVLSRAQLLDITHGPGRPVYERSIDVQVRRLRRKLSRSARSNLPLLTIRNGGYMLAAAVQPET